MHAWMYGWTCMNFYLLFYVILLREFKFILSVPKYGMVIGSCSSSHPSIIDMYACTCVYNSIYMWIFMYVCMYVCGYVCIHVCGYACMRVTLYLCILQVSYGV